MPETLRRRKSSERRGPGSLKQRSAHGCSTVRDSHTIHPVLPADSEKYHTPEKEKMQEESRIYMVAGYRQRKSKAKKDFFPAHTR
jgi:hypothetical protein